MALQNGYSADFTNSNYGNQVQPMLVSPDCDTYRMLRDKNMLLKDESGKAALVRWWNGAGQVLPFCQPKGRPDLDDPGRRTDSPHG